MRDLPSQEAGRYPAYKEMVAEYRWLNKCMYLKRYLSSGSNVFSLGLMFCVFLPKWQMEVRNLPPRVQTPPPRPLLSHLGLLSVL